MHGYYKQTLAICEQAEFNLIDFTALDEDPELTKTEKIDKAIKGGYMVDHGCHRHWAFALYKEK